jgi:hypothetical protein
MPVHSLISAAEGTAMPTDKDDLTQTGISVVSR